MARKTGKPIPVKNLNVWVTCKLQVINEDTMKWETLAEINDTPNSIKSYMKKHNLTFVWVKHIYGREMVTI